MQIYPMTTVPDVVRLPPDLGGAVAKVVHVDRHECPDCECEHDRWHLDAVAKGGGHIAVIECPVFGKYLWLRVPPPVSS